MESCRVPAIMKFEGNVSENWQKWYQKFELFLLASGKSSEVDQVKIALLLNLIGDEGLEVFNAFTYAKKDDKEKFDKVVKKFTEHCQPKKNIVFERFKFHGAVQKINQSIDQFVTEIKNLAKSCEFKEENSMIRDRIVIGIKNDAIKEKLLQISDLTTEKAIEVYKAWESSKKQVQEMSRKSENELEVEAVSSRKGRKENQDRTTSIIKYDCRKCGRVHEKGKCFAYGKQCTICMGYNHFAVGCFKKNAIGRDARWNKPRENQQRRRVNEVEEEGDFYIDWLFEEVSDGQISSNCLSLDSVGNSFGNNVFNDKQWFEIIKIEGNDVNCKLDTGAQCNVLPCKVFESLGCVSKLRKENTKLISYGGNKIVAEGSAILKCLIKETIICKIRFVIANVDSQPLLGLNTCVELKLIKRVDAVNNNINKTTTKEDIISNYKEVFDGLGTFPGSPYKIILQENASPKVHPPRRIANSIMREFKDTLERLKNAGVIGRVTEPTEWVNNIVITEKPNKKLRICLDPSDLNESIKREHYQLPTAEEIVMDLSEKKVFSILDLKDSFYQIILDDASARLCTFATPLGRFKFLRLPFGIKTAAEVFQRKNTEIFGNIVGNKIYIDDLIIAGSDEAEHDKILKEVLETAKTAGVTFNKEKFQYKQSEVKILGFIVSNEGIQIDKGRLNAIKDMEEPSNKKELLRFLGLVKYLGKFLPNLSQITAPIRELTKENIIWQWDQVHSDTVKTIKNLLTTAPVLAHYDNKKPLIVQTDASKDGIGACMLQEGKPIAYASRSLTDSEKRYAPIERELCAILYAIEKFHYYTYGKLTCVNTDHKPLVSIFKKDINKVSSRLQRMLLRLMKYELKVSYVPGKELFVADALSRAFLKDRVKDDPEIKFVIHSIIRNLPMSDEKKKLFKVNTQEDEHLKLVSEYIKEGWPANKTQVPINVRPYLTIKEELSELDGLIFLNNRVVVPNKLKNYVLKLIHEGHQGIVKSKMKARECLYWPGMTKEIEQLILNCEVCEKFRTCNAKQPLMSHPLPKRAWEKLGIDILEFGIKNYLIIVDYYSKWIEMISINSKSSEEIIRRLKQVFASHGFPDLIVADNVPFSSCHIKQYLNEVNCNLITSSPNYPRSNGQAEKAVGICKTMLKKCRYENGEISTYLLKYRNTPLPEIGLSPAQLLFNRRLKDKLPIEETLLQPKTNNRAMVESRMLRKQETQKKYYDKNTKDLKAGRIGDRVLLRLKNTWKQGFIQNEYKTPRSYTVQDDRGKLYRRNRQHLIVTQRKQHHRKTNVNPSVVNEESPTKNLRSRESIRKPARFRN